jgi:hypothetical protein
LSLQELFFVHNGLLRIVNHIWSEASSITLNLMIFQLIFFVLVHLLSYRVFKYRSWFANWERLQSWVLLFPQTQRSGRISNKATIISVHWRFCYILSCLLRTRLFSRKRVSCWTCFEFSDWVITCRCSINASLSFPIKWASKTSRFYNLFFLWLLCELKTHFLKVD